jgi:ferredoxin/Na+-translocating ferredoxin:NAD+ oxidoreductase RnfD subunit
MNSLPLIRVKWSNEHTMAVVFAVLVLYHIPRWSKEPLDIIGFLLLAAVGVLVDCVASRIRHRQIWCCVSAAVTAAMISILTDGVPILGQLLAVIVALLFGKHLWGGTGKNIVNPAMVGLLPIFLFFDITTPYFTPSLLLLPAVIASLIFLPIRLFAGLGLIAGMTTALILLQDLTLMNVLVYGVIFWGCLVMTDPVTVTNHPVAGAAASFFIGFTTLFYFPVPGAIVIGILAFNLFSAAIKDLPAMALHRSRMKLRIPKEVSFQGHQNDCNDLTEEKEETENHKEQDKDLLNLTAKELLGLLKTKGIFGMGGAGFPTVQKLSAVLEATEDKYLIINGVECDPGLLHDAWIMRNHVHEIQKGVNLLQSCIGFQMIYLAVKDDKGLDYEENIKVFQVPDYYPMGAEKILIKEILNKELSREEVPAKQGILVINIQTIYAIYKAVYEKQSLESRYLTVANLRDKTAKVVKARLGMKVKEIVDRTYPGAMNVFVGGGIMQSHYAEEDAVVDTKTNFIAVGTLPKYKESPQCMKCGNCTDNCPSHLMVNRIADLVDQGKLDKTSKYHPDECMECGSCSYSCLAGKDLATKIKKAKAAVL